MFEMWAPLENLWKYNLFACINIPLTLTWRECDPYCKLLELVWLENFFMDFSQELKASLWVVQKRSIFW